jgi:hypothetical protein
MYTQDQKSDLGFGQAEILIFELAAYMKSFFVIYKVFCFFTGSIQKLGKSDFGLGESRGIFRSKVGLYF